MARRAFTAPLKMTLVVVVAGLLAGVAVAHSAGASELSQRINRSRSRVSGLSRSIGAASQQITKLGHSVSSLQRRLSAEQAALSGDLTSLRHLRARYDVAHAHLRRLESDQARAVTVLRQQMVGQYESPQPDLVTVVVEAQGFQDLLERLGFAQRIQQRDARAVESVRVARRAVTHEAIRLGALELRERRRVAQVVAERNDLAHTQRAMVSQRDHFMHVRAAQTLQLTGARGRLASLRTRLARIQAARAASAQAGARAAARATPSPPSPTPPPPPSPTGGGPAPGGGGAVSTGGFTFPLPSAAASPPSTWSPDQGVDISAPGGTPEYAVCAGTIVLHGIGGFGPWAPVLHCDVPLRGYSYVYYGHAGPANQLSIGTHVAAGQVMSEVGPGIVGMSSGPHVEIGFCDATGTPLGTATAPTMLSLLQSSYHG